MPSFREGRGSVTSASRAHRSFLDAHDDPPIRSDLHQPQHHHAAGVRAPVRGCGILAALQLLITPVVQGLHNPGVGAEAILGLALWQLAPTELQNGAPPGHLTMSLAAIVTVLVS